MISSKLKFQKIIRRLLIGFLSTVFLFAAAWFFHYWHGYLTRGEKYTLKMIVQTGETETLKTMYLAEILGLSQDRPISYFDFSERKALSKLLNNPLIKRAKLKKIKPSFVYVDYALREPIALLHDYPNIALDQEGYLFPLFPFFSPKNLPEIYLDLPELAEKKEFFKEPLKSKNLTLAFDLLKILKTLKLQVKRIDTSQAFSKSFGKREIVLIIDEEMNKKYQTMNTNNDGLVDQNQNRQAVFVFPRILRLSPDDYAKQLANYFELRKKMEKDYQKQLKAGAGSSSVVYFKPKVVDLRISKLAFID